MRDFAALRLRRKRRSPRGEPLEPRCVLSFNFGDFPFLFDPPPPSGEPLPGPPPSDSPPSDESSGPFEEYGDLGASLLIVATTPADGGVVQGSLSTLVVEFDRPLDPYSLGIGDVTLERVNALGEVEFSFDPAVDVLAESLDETGTRLIVTLPPAIALSPGTYRIVLSESAFLTGVDFSLMESVGLRQSLATFQLQTASGASLADASDIGTVGPQIMRVDGALDFSVDPHAVDLYRFNLSAGHRWRLGIEAQAQRIGSPLDSALALFDASGNVILTADVGFSNAPNDPYFFAGLEPGVYFLGVSGAGNLPGEPGGYDPVAGTPEASILQRTGGEYRLRLVADIADEPTQLLGLQPTYADPLDPAPTGFTLEFSGAVAPKLASGDNDPFPAGVELVGEDGRVWSVVLANTRLFERQLDYVFDARLPLGRYSVRVTQSSGLADLAGDLVVGFGSEPGVLATFEIEAQSTLHDANDFGAVFPGTLGQTQSGGVSLQPGESISYRLVALLDFVAQVEFTHEGGTVDLEIRNATTGSTLHHVLATQGTLTLPLFFEPGEHFVTFRTAGELASNTLWLARGGSLLRERVDLSSVGQDSALRLRLVAPPSGSVNGGPALGSGGPSTQLPETSTGSPATAPPATSPQSGAGGGPIFGIITPPASTTGAGSAAAATGLASVLTLGSLQTSNAAPNITIAPYSLGGAPVGRVGAADETSLALASIAGYEGAGAFDVASVRVPTGARQRSRLQRRSESGESLPDAPPDGDAPLANADGSIDPSTATAALDGAVDSIATPGASPSALVDAILAQVADALRGRSSASPASVDSGAENPSLASTDPFARLLPNNNAADDASNPWIDPMTLVVTAAVLIEGRRCLMRWLGKRSSLQRLATRQKTSGLARA